MSSSRVASVGVQRLTQQVLICAKIFSELIIQPYKHAPKRVPRQHPLAGLVQHPLGKSGDYVDKLKKLRKASSNMREILM